MSSVALSYPKISGRFPPTSGERESFPSEKAPAPAKPVVIEHGLQPTHTFVFLFGQTRFSIGLPFSIIKIFSSGFSLISSYAQKIPDGPAPMMITSKCSPDFISQVSFRVSEYGHPDREHSLHTILYRIIVPIGAQGKCEENHEDGVAKISRSFSGKTQDSGIYTRMCGKSIKVGFPRVSVYA